MGFISKIKEGIAKKKEIYSKEYEADRAARVIAMKKSRAMARKEYIRQEERKARERIKARYKKAKIPQGAGISSIGFGEPMKKGKRWNMITGRYE